MSPEVNLELALDHGLTEEEYGWIVEKLGRIPTFVELGIYSVMWSEHCSYKNSIAELKKLPRDGEALLVGAGEENAGLVDIGDGQAVAFKIEPHNHPQRWSLTKAQRRVWAVSRETFLPWVLDPLRR